MKYHIFTLGCQMNIFYSERIDAVLKSCGLKPAPEDKADLIVVNACSVRQSAVDRIYGKLRKWQGKKIIITGCILPHDKRKLAKKVDLIFDIKNLPKLPQFLSQIYSKNYHAIEHDSMRYSLLRNKLRNKGEAFVPIMTGCDNFCTYCAVPYTRGREISRPEREIIAEVKELIKQGSKRIILLGQNVNNYGGDQRLVASAQRKSPFVTLLKKLSKLPGDFKISFLTPNPWNFPDELIELVAKEPKLSKEIHLPVQSGDDEVLKRMNRHYTAKEYLQLINDLRFRIHDLRLSTDIIVGFPGETKKAFENTVKLCKMAKFDKAYVAMYSPRPGTAATKLYEDDVPYEEKKRRWQILNKMINKN